MSRALTAEPIGPAFPDANARGESRQWQTLRLAYPDGATLYVDVDLTWPNDGESVADYGRLLSGTYRSMNWTRETP